MPPYLRKHINIGPLRVNFSKSGIGVSFGVTGLRAGLGPRGAHVHAGRKGLYYQKQVGWKQLTSARGNTRSAAKLTNADRAVLIRETSTMIGEAGKFRAKLFDLAQGAFLLDLAQGTNGEEKPQLEKLAHRIEFASGRMGACLVKLEFEEGQCKRRRWKDSWMIVGGACIMFLSCLCFFALSYFWRNY